MPEFTYVGEDTRVYVDRSLEVSPGDVIDWPDGPPDLRWESVDQVADDKAAKAAAKAEKAQAAADAKAAAADKAVADAEDSKPPAEVPAPAADVPAPAQPSTPTQEG